MSATAPFLPHRGHNSLCGHSLLPLPQCQSDLQVRDKNIPQVSHWAIYKSFLGPLEVMLHEPITIVEEFSIISLSLKIL